MVLSADVGRRQRINGFTLIEVLVVIFIISIVTSVALLSISSNENRKLEAFTNELVQTMTLAEEHAMLQPDVLGLSFTSQAYQFMRYQPAEGEKKTVWVPVQDKLLGSRAIPTDVEWVLEVGGKKAHGEDEDDIQLPQIVISPNGDITPFTIYVGKKGKSPRYVIKGNADGSITSKWLG